MNSPASATRTMPAASARTPVLLCAVVMAVAMMSFFVHVLESHVERGQRLRQGVAHNSAQPMDMAEMLQPLHIGLTLSH